MKPADPRSHCCRRNHCLSPRSRLSCSAHSSTNLLHLDQGTKSVASHPCTRLLPSSMLTTTTSTATFSHEASHRSCTRTNSKNSTPQLPTQICSPHCRTATEAPQWPQPSEPPQRLMPRPSHLLPLPKRAQRLYVASWLRLQFWVTLKS